MSDLVSQPAVFTDPRIRVGLGRPSFAEAAGGGAKREQSQFESDAAMDARSLNRPS